MSDIDDIGSGESFDAQQEVIKKRWGAEKLIEDGLKKEVSYEEVMSKPDAQGAKELFAPNDIDLKTEVNAKEVLAASRCLFMADRYQIGGLREFVQNYLRLKVSLSRKGRLEYIQGLHAEEKREQGRDMSPIQALLSGLGRE